MGDHHPRTRMAAVHAASVFLGRDGSVAKTCALIGISGAAPVVTEATAEAR